MKTLAIILSAASLAACATVPIPEMTAADHAAMPLIDPTTRYAADVCQSRQTIPDCQAAKFAMENDPQATPNMVALMDGAITSLRNQEARRMIGNFAYDVLAGPEQSIRSCSRGDCVRTTYRVSSSGRISDVNSY